MSLASCSRLARETVWAIGRRSASSAAPSYSNLLVSSPAPSVTLVTLNRPKALNALNSELMRELTDVLDRTDSDADVGAVVLTGSEKAFAAGADIKEMQNLTFAEAYRGAFLGSWEAMNRARKPIVGAVSGFALGGGCELAMMCDILLASSNAKFSQPEINLAVLPGMGGSQRLTRAIGKSRAMELILTGRQFSAAEAAEWGLISRVVDGDVVQEAVKVASVIASKGQLAIQAAKEAVNAAFELPLHEGLRLERTLFHAIFSTADKKEGMSAFVEKREAKFEHR